MDLLYDTKMDRKGIQEDVNISAAHSLKQQSLSLSAVVLNSRDHTISL